MMLSMATISPNSIARSSLEEMLETLRRSDEAETPKDLPPALPARPKATSRARLPSKRPLPTSVEPVESKPAQNLSISVEKKGKPRGPRGRSLGVKKVKELRESPYMGSDDNRNGDLEKFVPGSLPRLKEPEWDDVMAYFITEKLRVWCQIHNGSWKSGQIKSTAGEKALVLVSDGSVVTLPTQELLPANPSILDGVNDLTQLSYINEPSIVHSIQYRYSQDIPYTKTGPVLVAVNPLKDVRLYGNDFVTAYQQKLLDMPHGYTIAARAYDEMMADNINQSIIVSGKSGAGKTEIAKIALQYLTALSGGSDEIESKILQTSCILEAFGNAKTTRNDNSSRFGKLMEIYFSATGHICGAKIQTLLLEKSRVVQLVQGERSYHLFYQLCSGAPSELRGRLRLKRASDYNYLNQSDCLEIRNIDDAQKFRMLVEALFTLGVSKEDQGHVFEMVSAVLWLGNISFLVTDNQNHIEVVADEAVANAASLMGCSEQDLVLALSTRKVQAGKDKVTRRLTQQQAIEARDALAKFIYTSLFDWLVQEINSLMTMGKQNTARSISILDISGFESREKNSFEQFCINYANERLQQHFIRHLFKLRQEEYELDGVEGTTVEFEDNQDTLDLLEKKDDGLISLLDEVSNTSKATDLTFASKLKQQLNTNNCFKVERGGTFTVRHFAGEVLYETGKFLEKNRDPLPSETVQQLLLSCTGRLPQYFVSALTQSGMSTFQKRGVASKFKEQLFKLMQHLESTKSHFIYCIEPNRKQIPGVFEQDLALEQLRCCGILEVVRISRFGYPTSMTHQEFTRRYSFLLPAKTSYQDPQSKSIAILQRFGILPETYQVGYTKLYLRSGQIGRLEDARKQVKRGTLEIQKNFPGSCHDFHELNGAMVTLQSYVRGEIARRKYRAVFEKEQSRAVVQIQSVIRGWLARRHFYLISEAKQANVTKLKLGRRISEFKDPRPEMLPLGLEELKKQVVLAQATLEQKEKENMDLKEQVKQYSIRWSEYEGRMKSMEETWQKQMVSLQMSLATTKKSIGTDNSIIPLGRHDGAQSPQYYDSEDMSMGTQTPGGCTPGRLFNNGIEDLAPRDMNGGLNHHIGPLSREFEQRRLNFDEQAQTILDARSGHSVSVNNPAEELRRLRHRFEAWKKDFKIRLKDTKAKVHRAEAEKHRRTWWGKKR